MLKETSLSFAGLSDKADMFCKDLHISSQLEEDDNGEQVYMAVLSHQSLGLSQTIRESNENILTFKAQQTINQWIQAWSQKHIVESRIENIRKHQQDWEKLLSKSLDKSHAIDLEQLKNKEPFESSPIFVELQSKLDSILIPAPPKISNTPPRPVYNEPEISFSQKMMLKKGKIINRYEQEYNKKLDTWQKICDRMAQNFTENMEEYQRSVLALEAERDTLNQEIDAARFQYEEQRLRKNEGTDIMQINYQSKQPEAVEQYFELVMLQSDYPEIFPRNTVLEYHRDNQTLFISSELPHPSHVPREKDLQFISSENHEVVGYYSAEEFSNLYNDIIYKSVLRTFHEIFDADHAHAVEAVNYIGWVRTLNRGNGQYENSSIISLFATRTDFEKINLKQIDPTLCFRFLKGSSAPSLIDLKPIPTSFTINKKSREQVQVINHLEPIDNSTNLANIGWLDFEKLMMDLFEKEFGSVPGEIKLIHSSLENGLEAYGMDKDPLRGGKIVFHAKRSIKPMQVSAVKEIFGSVIHEGAIKGILITTTEFSPEAYEFAKNKPISLINGISLLSLFEKHGQKLRINLREAISLETWLS